MNEQIPTTSSSCGGVGVGVKRNNANKENQPPNKIGKQSNVDASETIANRSPNRVEPHEHHQSEANQIENDENDEDGDEPWKTRSDMSKYLFECFSNITSRGGKNLSAKCNYCDENEPSKNFLKGNSSNLKKHISKVHIFFLFLFCTNCM